MLYYLSLLESYLSELRLFQYITFRTLGAAAIQVPDRPVSATMTRMQRSIRS